MKLFFIMAGMGLGMIFGVVGLIYGIWYLIPGLLLFFGAVIGHPRRMDQNAAPACRRPAPDFNRFQAMDKQGRPGLLDG